MLLNINPKHKRSLNNRYFIQKSIYCNIPNSLTVYNIVNYLQILSKFSWIEDKINLQYSLIFAFWISYRKSKIISIFDYWKIEKSWIKLKIGKIQFWKTENRKQLFWPLGTRTDFFNLISLSNAEFLSTKEKQKILLQLV